MFERRWLAFLCLIFGVVLFSRLSPVYAKEETWFPKLDSLFMADFDDHYQTVDGHQISFPALTLGANVGIAPLWRIEFRYVRGTSPLLNNFQASVKDFEGRLGHRLDNPLQIDRDTPGQHVFGWVSWRVWSSTHLFNGVSEYDRQEGLGLGVSRSPSTTRALSYGYAFGFYPSVRVRVGQAISRISLEAGPVYRIDKGFSISLSYRYQAILTSGLPHQRAQEQGMLYGVRGSF